IPAAIVAGQILRRDLTNMPDPQRKKQACQRNLAPLFDRLEKLAGAGFAPALYLGQPTGRQPIKSLGQIIGSLDLDTKRAQKFTIIGEQGFGAFDPALNRKKGVGMVSKHLAPRSITGMKREDIGRLCNPVQAIEHLDLPGAQTLDIKGGA